MHKKHILSLSHLDLDGIGCQIVLRSLFGEITRMNTSYGKIEEYINIIDEYCSRESPEKVFITDLSFTYDLLKQLSIIANKFQNIKFYFIDHHPFENGDYHDLVTSNLTIIITDKASATKLTYLFLKANYNLHNEKLEKFVSYINAYDIWLKNTPEFKVGFVYNELFWKYKIDYFWSKFKDNYNLSNTDKDNYKELLHKKSKLFNKLEKSGRIMKFSDRILVIFVDDYQSFITIDYPNFLSYVIIRSNGGVSVRLDEKVSKDGILKNNLISKILELDYIDEAGGHNGAFGTRIIDSNPHKMVEFSKHISNLLDIELDKIKG